MLKGYEYEIARVEVGGIKCDTAGCGWNDMSVTPDQYTSWINKPCPDCGGNLLTEKDYIAFVNFGAKVIQINLWCNKWLPKFLLKMLSGGKTVVKLGTNGDGIIRRRK